MLNGENLIPDSLYGSISLPAICQDFLQTPEFQRLRRVKQLGNIHYLFPGAVHTRFEHSIGVSHLAGKILSQIATGFGPIDPRTRDLIQLAGLYHDIGHMAYSHLFDSFLELSPIPAEPGIFSHPTHEARSVYLLQQVNRRLQILTPGEEQMVANCILGIVPDGELPFLYQIINNRRCGVDVDKLDYLARDAYHCGLSPFDSTPIVESATVNSAGELSFHPSAISEITTMFDRREMMFRQIYQHPIAYLINRLHVCLMHRLGPKLYQFQALTDDFNLESLFRSIPELSELVHQLDTGTFDHICSRCAYFDPPTYYSSGSICEVPFFSRERARL